MLRALLAVFLLRVVEMRLLQSFGNGCRGNRRRPATHRPCGWKGLEMTPDLNCEDEMGKVMSLRGNHADGRKWRIASTHNPCNPDLAERNHMLNARRRFIGVALAGQLTSLERALLARPPPKAETPAQSTRRVAACFRATRNPVKCW